MKILFTGPLEDMSGFATASRNFLHSISLSDKFDVAARSLKYDALDPGQKFIRPEWLHNLLSKDTDNVDCLIQMTTCNVEAVTKPGILNGLYTFFEVSVLPPTWVEKAKQFDFIIVPCKANALALHNSGVTEVPILVVPPPCDKDFYNVDNIKPFEIKNSENRTIFYNICQLSSKKGIDALLRAYYAAFYNNPDEVLLVLKTYVNMSDRKNDLDIIKKFIERIKTGCNIPTKLPPVLPIVDILSETEIAGLHLASDAYVCSSRAEGWGIPPFDALCFGKTLISNNFGGLEAFVTDENSLRYGGCVNNCFDSAHPEPWLYSGVGHWFEPSTAQMSYFMQYFHFAKKQGGEEWNKILAKREVGKKLSSIFDYRSVSSQICNQLLAAIESYKLCGKVKFEN